MTETVLEKQRQQPVLIETNNSQECPYPGPRPYQYGEQRKFYGRNADVEHLKSLLLAERIVFLHGPSGTGKSSLIRAGLLPQLGHFEIADITLRHPLPALYKKEGINPFVYSLAISIETSLSKRANKSATIDSTDTSALRALLQLPPATYLQRRIRTANPGKHLLLVFDQFEELFTAAEHEDAARREFLVELANLLVDSEIWALFVLRDEYMPQLLRFRQYVPSHVDNTYSLDYLDGNAARTAIREPAERWGGHVEEDVVEKLVKGLSLDGDSHDASVRIDPLHLQLVCIRLWHNRKFEHSGGPSSASSTSGAVNLEKLPPTAGSQRNRRWLIDMQVLDSVAPKRQAEQLGQRVVDAALVAYIDNALATASKHARREEYKIRMWLEDNFIREGRYRERIVEPSEGDPRLVVVLSLEKKSILRLDPKIDSTWYELSHDRLVAPFQESNRRWFATRGNVSDFVQLAREYCHAGSPENFKTLPKRQWQKSEPTLDGADPLTQPSHSEREYQRFCEQKHKQKTRLNALVSVFVLVLAVLGWQQWDKWKQVTQAEIQLERANAQLSLTQQQLKDQEFALNKTKVRLTETEQWLRSKESALDETRIQLDETEQQLKTAEVKARVWTSRAKELREEGLSAVERIKAEDADEVRRLSDKIAQKEARSKALGRQIEQQRNSMKGLTQRSVVDRLVSMSLANRWRRHNQDLALLLGIHAHKVNQRILDPGRRRPATEIHDVLQSALSAAPYSGTYPKKAFDGVRITSLGRLQDGVIAFGMADMQLVNYALSPTLGANSGFVENCENLMKGRFVEIGKDKLAIFGENITIIDRQKCQLLNILEPPDGVGLAANMPHWVAKEGDRIGAFMDDGSIAFYDLMSLEQQIEPQVLTVADWGDQDLALGARIENVTGADRTIAVADDNGNVCIILDAALGISCALTLNPLMQAPQWPGIDYRRLAINEHRHSKAIAAMALDFKTLWIAYKGGTPTGGARVFAVNGLDAMPVVREMLPDAGSRALWEDAATKGSGSIKVTGEAATTASFEKVGDRLYLATGGEEGSVWLWNLSHAVNASSADDFYLARRYGISANAGDQDVRSALDRSGIKQRVRVVPVEDLAGLVSKPLQVLLTKEGSVPVVFALTGDGTVRYWRTERNPYAFANVSWDPDLEGTGDAAFVYALAFDSRGDLVTTNNRGEVRRWYVSNSGGAMLVEPSEQFAHYASSLGASIRSLDFGSEWAAIGLGDRSVSVFGSSASTHDQAKEHLRLGGPDDAWHKDGIWETRFRPSNENFGQRYDLVSADWQGRLVFWNLQFNEAARERALVVDDAPAVLDVGAPVLSMAFHKDGRYLLVGSTKPSLTLVDLDGACGYSVDQPSVSAEAQSPCKVWTVDEAADEALTAIHAVAFRPDGKAFAVVGEAGMVLELEFDTTDVRQAPSIQQLSRGLRRGHRGTVKDAVYVTTLSSGVADTPFILATAGRDGRLGVWPSTAGIQGAARGRNVFLTSDDGVSLLSVAGSPDGRFIAAGSGGRRFRVWALDAIDQACRTVGDRKLTQGELYSVLPRAALKEVPLAADVCGIDS